MQQLSGGSVFSGIGGIELGLERAGMRTLWQVEINPFATAVLKKHWPNVRRYADVKEVGAHNLEPVDVICGGFPCQDISVAGKGAGIKEGTRSGLWFEFARIVRELRPRYVLVENVPVLRSRGLHIVLGDLAACGYDAEWDCIPAAAVGAPHRRDRIWIVAYPSRYALLRQEATERSVRQRTGARGESGGARDAFRADVPNPDSESQGERGEREAPSEEGARGRNGGGGGVAREEPVRRTGEGSDVADPEGLRRPARWASDTDEGTRGWGARGGGLGAHVADADDIGRHGWPRIFWQGRRPQPAYGSQWLLEPNVGRVAHGIPARVDRLTALGNAVVPQVAEYIGRLIVADHERQVAEAA